MNSGPNPIEAVTATLTSPSPLNSPVRSAMKRTHDEIQDHAVQFPGLKGHVLDQERGREQERRLDGGSENRDRSMTSELSDVEGFSVNGSSRGGTPAAGVNATQVPSAFAALNGNALPPPKKAKLTCAEKEDRRIAKEIRDRERAEERARKEAERQAHAEEKARKDAEREVERKKREAEKEEKRLAMEAEKAAKEEKRRKKEEEKQKLEEEKRKKESKQRKVTNFFAMPTKDKSALSVAGKERSSMSPAPTSIPNDMASPAASTPSKPQLTPYEKMFLGFEVRPDVTLAPITRFERDEETSEAVQKIIDSYIIGNRSPGRTRDFDAQDLFHLSNTAPRGKYHMPVREIMEEMSGKSSRPIDLTTDSQNSQIRKTADLLKSVPYKILHFQEDVRPPYRGTYTSQPKHGMARLARNPLRRDLPDMNYDYDSEAEWVEDEDAEDLKSEADDEEELDDDEDMDGFLDDENDESAQSKRLVLQGDLEPVSTGLCWEDRKKMNSNAKMMMYRMEVILDPAIKSIDPFSTSYWEIPKSKSMDPPRIPLNNMKPPNTNVPLNSASLKTFFTPASDPQTTQSSTQPPPTQTLAPSDPNQKPKKLIPQEDMPAFKQEVEGSNLSKVGLIEVLKKKFPGRSAAAIKATLESVAKRVGAKEVDKRWVVISA